MKVLLIFFCLAYTSWAHATKIYIIEHVSNEKTIFVINHGISDGIIAHQKSLFTSDNFSLVAEAVKVTRFYSVWKPLQKNYPVPFTPGTSVMFNHNRDGIFKEIPQLVQEYKTIATYKKQIIQKRHKFFKYAFKVSSISGISESTSTVDYVDQFTRLGQHYSLWYNYKLSDSFQLNGGLRFDDENLKLSDPALTIPVKRNLLMLAFTYLFNGNNLDSSYYTYCQLAIGYGQATSNISGVTAEGTSVVMPKLSIGVQLKLNNDMAFMLEAGFETIKTNDLLATGVAQENIQTDMLLTGGVTF